MQAGTKAIGIYVQCESLKSREFETLLRKTYFFVNERVSFYSVLVFMK